MLDNIGTESEKPEVKKGYRQSQARQAQEMAQAGAFQVKAIVFEVAKGFLNPPAAMNSKKMHLCWVMDQQNKQ